MYRDGQRLIAGDSHHLLLVQHDSVADDRDDLSLVAVGRVEFNYIRAAAAALSLDERLVIAECDLCRAAFVRQHVIKVEQVAFQPARCGEIRCAVAAYIIFKGDAKASAASAGYAVGRVMTERSVYRNSAVLAAPGRGAGRIGKLVLKRRDGLGFLDISAVLAHLGLVAAIEGMSAEPIRPARSRDRRRGSFPRSAFRTPSRSASLFRPLCRSAHA